MHGVWKVTSTVERCLSGLYAIYYRGGFDSYGARNFLTNTSRLHDKDVAKEEPVKSGTENNMKDTNTFRWSIYTWVSLFNYTYVRQIFIKLMQSKIENSFNKKWSLYAVIISLDICAPQRACWNFQFKWEDKQICFIAWSKSQTSSFGNEINPE